MPPFFDDVQREICGWARRAILQIFRLTRARLFVPLDATMAHMSAKSMIVALRTPDARVSALGIARATARDIERGVYQTGARLREQELADRFKCSRAPVREALRILESQGFVVIEAMKGARVATTDDADFVEVFLIRRALASMMVRQLALAPASISKSRFIALSSELPRRAEAAISGHAFADDVRQTVRVMVEAAQMPRTVQIVKSITFGHEAFQDEIVEPMKNRVAQARCWARIGDAVAVRDGEAARAAMEKIFDDSRAYMEQMKPQRPRSKSRRPKKAARRK